MIREREYTIVRVTADDGTIGVAYSLSRGAPIAETVDRLVAPLVLGEDAVAVSRVQERIEQGLRLLGLDGFLLRAISLVDICLWDIRATSAGVPLWRLLGEQRDTVPVLLVDCYAESGDAVHDLVERLRRRVADGYRALKIHAPDPAVMTELLGNVRKAVGSDVSLVVDLAMSAPDLQAAISAIRSWSPFDPAWVEDPFRGEETELLRRLREAVDVPIGAGDEVASRHAIERLITDQAVDVVRLDATCHGGISGMRRLCELAAARGVRVSAHTYPELHRHCSFAWSSLDHVEAFAPASEYDRSEAFIDADARVRAVDGHLTAPEQAGAGIQVDWPTVTGSAVRSTCARLPTVAGDR